MQHVEAKADLSKIYKAFVRQESGYSTIRIGEGINQEYHWWPVVAGVPEALRYIVVEVNKYTQEYY